jgi:hypothetical protein
MGRFGLCFDPPRYNASWHQIGLAYGSGLIRCAHKQRNSRSSHGPIGNNIPAIEFGTLAHGKLPRNHCFFWDFPVGSFTIYNFR